MKIEDYLKKYGPMIEEFGTRLRLKTDPNLFIFNPGVGGDLANLLLLTNENASIFVTDLVPLDDTQLGPHVDVPEGIISHGLELKGESNVACYFPMHHYFNHRLRVLGYTIDSIDKQENGVIYLKIRRGDIQRNLYYLKTNHSKQLDNARLLEALKKTVLPTNRLVYLQKALEPHITYDSVYRNFLRNLYESFNSMQYIIDGTEQKYPAQGLPVSFPSDPNEERFCYGNNMWYVSRILSEVEILSDYLREKGPKLQELEDKIKSIDRDNPSFTLLRVFSLKQARYIETCSRPNFQNDKDVDGYLSEMYCALGGYDCLIKQSVMPLGQAIKASQIPVPMKFMNRKNRSARELWDRIGLGEAYSALFSNEDTFWNSGESLLSIYEKLRKVGLETILETIHTTLQRIKSSVFSFELFFFSSGTVAKQIVALKTFQSALRGEHVNLSTVANLLVGTLYQPLHTFMETGKGSEIIGKNVTSLDEFIHELQTKNSAQHDSVTSVTEVAGQLGSR